MITQVWQNFPFAAMLILAGLSSLPEEPFEAARLDGATAWQTLRHVTIPLLRPILLVVILFRTIFALRTFEIIWLLTGGGPADATMVYSVSIYRESFRYYDLGAASALSWVLLIFSAVTGVAFVLLSRRASQEAYA
jgi:multiple sugar transport system permease protein